MKGPPLRNTLDFPVRDALYIHSMAASANFSDISALIGAASPGGGFPSEELLPLVYDELRHLAARRVAGHGSSITMQATALVHEAWLRLGGADTRLWNDKTHFFRTAALAMRGVLVDRARRKSAVKRSDRLTEVNIDDCEISAAEPEDRLLMIDEALDRLERCDETSARIVNLKFFGGLTNRQIAELNGVTERTIERQWAYARLKLYEMIEADANGDA
jgi:RNA polymerase sigma factor (TIGR02999 family)